MKRKFAIVLVAVLLLFSSSLYAQKKMKYTPEKGHWQLVSNIHDKKTVTVQFYTDEGTMIYQETIKNKKMNPARTKVRRQLYYALKEAYDEWTAKMIVNGNDLVAKRN